MAKDKGGELSRRVLLQASGATLAAFGASGLASGVGDSSAHAAAADAHAKPRSKERYVTVVEGTNIATAVSPDGRTIAFDLYGVLWLVDVGGGAARRLTDDYSEIAQPDWSPDGRTLVFQSYRDGNFHLWRIGADGSGLKQLTTGPYDCREPRFAPDGLRVAFSSDRSGRYAIYMLDLGSGRTTPLAQATGQDSPTAQEAEPAWSPVSSSGSPWESSPRARWPICC